MMNPASARTAASLAVASALAMFLGACGSTNFSSAPPPVAESAPPPEIPSTIRPNEIVGNWGLASFQNPADRARAEAAARVQCKNPYVIGAGSSGGVVMYLPDNPEKQELRLKGSPSGKNYIGPAGPTPGEQDREIVSFDGRVMILRAIDKDAATRYGNETYVRCAPRA